LKPPPKATGCLHPLARPQVGPNIGCFEIEGQQRTEKDRAEPQQGLAMESPTMIVRKWDVDIS